MAQGQQYSTTITATTSGSGVLFTSSATGSEFRAHSVTFINDSSAGSGGVSVNFTTTSGATTSDHSIKAGESFSINAPAPAYLTGLSYVASTAGGSHACRIVALTFLR